MRKSLLLASGLALSSTLIAIAQEPAAPTTAPTSAPAAPTSQQVLERVSYGYGMNVGRDLAKLGEYGITADLESFQAGLRDGMAAAESKYSEADMMAAFEAFQTTLMEKEASAQQAQMEKATAEGKAFLEANKSKEGVQTTASGLQYQIIEEGKGPQPKDTDTVKVHYTGTLIDGTVFDSSVKRGEPVEFPLDGVIRGWTEGFQLFKVGTKAKLFIPADLAYGMRSPTPTIPPNSTLIFEVELLEIVPPAAQDVEPAMPNAEPTSPQQP